MQVRRDVRQQMPTSAASAHRKRASLVSASFSSSSPASSSYGDYSYYSEGSGSYRPTSSEPTTSSSTSASVRSAASTATRASAGTRSSLSQTSSSPLTPPAALSRRVAARPATSTPDLDSEAAARAPAAAAATAGALVPTSVDVAPVSPYHFSEEELLRFPSPAEGEAATPTHTSEEGCCRGGHAAGVLETIVTVPIAVPPPPEEAQRRRDEGGLPYPSHLTFHLVPGPPPSPGSGPGEGGVGGTDLHAPVCGVEGAATPARAHKTFLPFCHTFFHRRRDAAQRTAEAHAAMRQRSHHEALRSHHVPLVKFRTTRERDGAGVVAAGDGNTLPRVEEAAGYRVLQDDVMGAEARPSKLRKAMRQQQRPASGLRLRTSYAFGRRAGGGPGGAGQSAYLRDGDPQRFWIAQLHERAHVHLEPIETQ
ncbi:hypothetical protein NESM_000211900 [Novymonas esmeraldas]|uniref:Uncharacterized protein n=1 Tax=Novymonas esmeraldas TaxID=1808958 RepID=A0AAW0F6X1_9TRYP